MKHAKPRKEWATLYDVFARFPGGSGGVRIGIRRTRYTAERFMVAFARRNRLPLSAMNARLRLEPEQ